MSRLLAKCSEVAAGFLAIAFADRSSTNRKGASQISLSFLLAVSICNKEGFLTRSIAKPPNGHFLAVAWKRCNDLLVSWLLKSISLPIASTFFYMSDAVEIWEKLAQRLAQPDDMRICFLQ
ncbi:hypothetical protein L6164_017590 [Bauhinia variegata]|uniref:Uncharacterized protein n=1 Tax=Bauhinia variegata TaxID=167791 RepID=A0ACB9NAG1_BAUVA|nr:hypothetical protein L6164_017590 [Bauhinia variegata]